MAALDDLQLLRTFVRIAETGSISRAASSMSVPQPTVSRRLRQLEATLGVVLVQRDTHVLSLTDAGQHLLEDARDILGRVSAAAERLHEGASAARGHLRIMSVVDSGQWVVPRLLAGFRKVHPDVTADLHLINRPSKFAQEGFDCGIVAGAITDSAVAVRKVCEVERKLVAAPALLKEHGVPNIPEELQKLPWMGVLQPHFSARDEVRLIRGRKQQIVRLSPVLVMDSVTALREAAIAGAGLTLQPDWLLSEAFRKGVLVHVLPKWKLLPVQISVVFPTGRISAAARAFVDYAAETIPKIISEIVADAGDGFRRAAVDRRAPGAPGQALPA